MSNISKLIAGDKLAIYQYVIEFINRHYQFSFPTTQLTEKMFSDIMQNLVVRINLAYITPAKSKLGVADLGEIFSFSQQKPHFSKTALIIIDKAETLTLEASNKLLKIVEEPPAYLQIFILTTSASKIINTLKSRCILVEFKTGNKTSNSYQTEFPNILNQPEIKLIDYYFKLDKLLTDAKDNVAKKEALKEFTILVNIELSNNIRSENLNLNNLERVTRLQKSLEQVNRGLNANVNTKLILDKLFLELLT